MRPPQFNPGGSFPQPPPGPDPGMVAAYLHWKKGKENERRRQKGSAAGDAYANQDYLAYQVNYPVPTKHKRGWVKVLVFLVILILLAGAASVILGGGPTKSHPKPPIRVRSVGLIQTGSIF